MPTYTHNDYYGYINKIQEKAISNPEWFWSESPDASEARQWLYNNGASSIVDDIYKNTPDEMKMRIPAKMLDKITRENRVVDRQQERTNAAAKNVAMTGVAIAGMPALVSTAAVAPIATGINMLTGVTGGFTGSILGKAIGRHVFTNDVENGIPTVHSNGDKGEEWGGLIGGSLGGAVGAKYGQGLETKMLKNYGYENETSLKDMLLNFKTRDKYEGWYRPAETYTNATRAKDAQAYTNALDNVQRYFNVTKPKHTKSYNGYKEIVPEINFSTKEPMVELFNNDNPPSFSLSESGVSIDSPVYNKDKELPFYIQRRYAAQLNHAVDEAKAASAFYKKFNWKRHVNINSDDEVLAALLKRQYKEPTITLDPTKSMWESFNDNGHSVIGIKENVFEPHSFPNDRVYLRGVIAHEGGHNNPLYNTAAVTDNLTDNQKAALFKESPLYHWDYSRVPEWTKHLLKPRKNVFNAHDIELAESYSDLIGEKALMEKFNLGRDGKYSYLDLLRYKYGKPQGRKTRFFLQHPGLRQQYKAFNEIE